MAAARQDPVLSCDSCRHGSDVHRSKVRMWQGLAATAAFLGCSSQQAAATQAVKGECWVGWRKTDWLAFVAVCLHAAIICSPPVGYHQRRLSVMLGHVYTQFGMDQ